MKAGACAAHTPAVCAAHHFATAGLRDGGTGERGNGGTAREARHNTRPGAMRRDLARARSELTLSRKPCPNFPRKKLHEHVQCERKQHEIIHQAQQRYLKVEGLQGVQAEDDGDGPQPNGPMR